jgi:pimeloyl-ACP methyl ester carboxylesterase
MPFATTDGARIYYEVHGQPEARSTVVFAHGAGGNRLSWWQQVPDFGERHRVVVFDHRSFGRSRCEAGSFSTAHFADDLLTVLDAEEIDRAALVCQSMGGWTGLPLAMKRPDRVSSLVLCGTPGGLHTEGIGEALSETGERVKTAGPDVNPSVAPDFPKRRPDMAFLYIQIAGLNTHLDRSGLGALLGSEARITPGSLEGYATPTLVIAGVHDILFPLAVMREVAELIPGARLVEFAGSGHSTYFEEPDAFNRVVGEFVAKHA